MSHTTRSAAAALPALLCLLAAPLPAQASHHSPAASSSAQMAAEEALHGDRWYGQVLVEELEYRWQDGHDVTAWDAQAWYGGDYNKIRLKTEGAFQLGEGVEEAEVQLLYSRLVGYYWDVQAGLRHDIRPEPSRSYGVIGLQGLAPGFFEIDLAGFVSEEGDLSVRLKAEYDLLVTQYLILQPRAEINLAVQDVPELGIGQGLNDIELGLRLRYEIAREFAPYVGVLWNRKLGETATFARNDGEDADVFSLLAGVRFWF
jgi:copper resistance protein B